MPPKALRERICLIMSKPTLGWTHNQASVSHAFSQLGIYMGYHTGVFWGQALEGVMTSAVEHGFEYILVVDYDSLFEAQHIVQLVRLIDEMPDALAIAPVEIRRASDSLLIGLRDEHGKPMERVNVPDIFKGKLTRVATAHFGLTVIRVSQLKKIPHPWFWAQPGADGTWGEDRTDSDIHFWREAERLDLPVYQANRIRIGQLQVIATWPGEHMACTHQYVLDWEEWGPPNGVRPYPGYRAHPPIHGIRSFQASRQQITVQPRRGPMLEIKDVPCLKLDLGCGNSPLDGYIGIDRASGQEAYPLPYPDESVDEIRASHVLEHFPMRLVLSVLRDWARALKPSGILKVAVPDLEYCARQYLAARSGAATAGEPLLQYIHGSQANADDFHYASFDEPTLRTMFAGVGLIEIQPWPSDADDCTALPVSLNLMGTKPRTPVHIDPSDAFAAKAAERFGTIEEVHFDTEDSAGESGAEVSTPEVMPSPIGHPSDTEHPMSVMSLYPDTEWLPQRAHNRTSQYGEDGILAAVFERIGTKNKQCLEVGAGNGKTLSNTWSLGEQGWKRILVEMDDDYFATLAKDNAAGDKVYHKQIVPTGENSLDAILSDAEAPLDIDLLSLDIDGQDYHVWAMLIRYWPRVMLVEYSMLDDADYLPTVGGKGQAGINQILKLGAAKGYVAVCKTSCNVVFVRSDLAPLLEGSQESA